MAGVALPWRGHHRTVVSRSGKGRCGLVTGLASRGDRDVVRWFAQRRRAVVTGRTATDDPRVTELCSRKRRRGSMARIAGLRRRHVTRRFTPRCRAVMAGGAGARHHTSVIVTCAGKYPIRRTHSMAGIARSSSSHVPSRLPRSLDTVVASSASTWPNSSMFEGRTSPANRPVATVAGHGRRNMGRRLA